MCVLACIIQEAMPKIPQYTTVSGHILQNANEHASLANLNHNALQEVHHIDGAAERCQMLN